MYIGRHTYVCIFFYGEYTHKTLVAQLATVLDVFCSIRIVAISASYHAWQGEKWTSKLLVGIDKNGLLRFMVAGT